MYTFNLFGDPSLAIQGIIIEENHPPNTPIIDGENTGNPDTEYTFCITASDPDEDSLYVKWDWNDGTTSDWLGPFISGSEVCDSHIWDADGSYTVSVTVEDEHGLNVTAHKEVSIVTIPRYRYLHISYFYKMLERFPILYQILQFVLIR
jgi:hypothetical protein